MHPDDRDDAPEAVDRTCEKFLPALGVSLGRPRGSRPDVDAGVTDEFATVGYRAHGMIHGEIGMESEGSRHDAATIALLRSRGIEIERAGDDLEIAAPPNVAFGHPQLVTIIGPGPVLQGLGGEPRYRDDEQIDTGDVERLDAFVAMVSEPQVRERDGRPANEVFSPAPLAALGHLDGPGNPDSGSPDVGVVTHGAGRSGGRRPAVRT